MTGFKLDTSGSVRADIPGLSCPVFWDDLSPFAQGYIAGALEELWPVFDQAGPMFAWRCAFRFLAPATLAAMLEDCERALRPGLARDRQSQDSGAAFWALRQRGTYADPRSRQPFPPVQISLADDGKIHQREGGR